MPGGLASRGKGVPAKVSAGQRSALYFQLHYSADL